MHQSYQLGTRLRVDAPQNHFPLHDDKRPAVLIAGGIGITPIKAMVDVLKARGSDFTLHYAGRSRESMAYLDWFKEHIPKALRIYSGDDGDRLNFVSVFKGIPDDAQIYLCGPPRMVAAALKVATEAGIHHQRLQIERFSGKRTHFFIDSLRHTHE